MPAIAVIQFTAAPPHTPGRLLHWTPWEQEGSEALRILLVEDDPLLGDGLRTALVNAGHMVDWVTDGRSGLQAARLEPFDLVLLDLTLPGMDGMKVLGKLRQADDPVPVIVLTARDTVEDRVSGLDLGADDYLIKPFETAELKARIRAVRRRHTGRASPRLVHGELELDPAARVVTYKGEAVELQRRELDLLQHLLENSGKVLSKDALADRLYGWQEGIESNAIEVHIHHLRKKLYPELIQTVRGIGYTIGKPAS